MYSCILTSFVAPTTAPRNVTVKRFIDGIFVSWNELLASESRGNPTYVVQYQSTMSGSSAQTVHTSEKFAVIENLVSDETYTVSVAAAVNASGGLMTGPSSSSVMAPSSGKLSSRCHDPWYTMSMYPRVALAQYKTFVHSTF